MWPSLCSWPILNDEVLKPKWAEAEQKTADMLELYGWDTKIQIGSGNHWRNPSDIIATREDARIHVEVKHTSKRSKSISLNELNKIERESIKHGTGEYMLVLWIDDKPFAVVPADEYLYWRSE